MKSRLDWSPPEAAAALLPEFTREFYRAGREAFAKGDYESLHEFRIAAKKFRYALELFQPLYGPKFAGKLAGLNDLATARTLVTDREAGEFPGWLEKESAAVQARLEKYWRDTVDTSGAEQGWTQYLKRYAGRKPVRKVRDAAIRR
jgi:CHAD domain-containing protein